MKTTTTSQAAYGHGGDRIEREACPVCMGQQPPHGGCVNCGGTVRTRKGGMWLCAKCYRGGVR